MRYVRTLALVLSTCIAALDPSEIDVLNKEEEQSSKVPPKVLTVYVYPEKEGEAGYWAHVVGTENVFPFTPQPEQQQTTQTTTFEAASSSCANGRCPTR